MKIKILKPLIATSILAVASTTNAALLAQYADGPETDAAALADKAANASVVASALDNVGFEGGTSITRDSFGVATPNGEDWLFVRARESGATAVSTDDYFGFTVSVAGTDTLSLTSFTFDLINIQDAGTGYITSYSVFVNVDGAGFNSLDSGSFNGAGTTKTYADAGNISVNLTSITGASSVEVRLAIADNSGSNSQATFVQDLELNGDVVAVPEPSSTALLGLGGLALILRRRK